jgi:L-lactate dehydrogenase complex protein LldF
MGSAVAKAVRHAMLQRNAAAAGVPDWEELRAQAKAIREETLERLDELLDQLGASIRKAGGTVHFASDAGSARAILLELVRSHGVRRVVKSKSMVSEEIALNATLQKAGVEVIETDFGEFIVQLAGERPSHITAPAIHKSAAEIAALLSRHLGRSLPEDPHALLAAARAYLRARFLDAGMGIIGVNFAVAETGTLVVVENEGNARMVSTIPPLLVAIMSLEKVTPSLADLSVFLRLLPRSATGQVMTSYVSLISGPYPGQELHVVVVDNGRRRILADSAVREILRCIRCGACMNACPVYRTVGGHAYGWVYTGPMGAVLSPLLLNAEDSSDLPFASTLCGACKEVCPVDIDLPRLLLELRRRAAPAVSTWSERWVMSAWALVGKSQTRFTLGGRLVRALLRLPRGLGRIYRVFPLLSGWTTSRDLPLPPVQSFRERGKRP